MSVLTRTISRAAVAVSETHDYRRVRALLVDGPPSRARRDALALLDEQWRQRPPSGERAARERGLAGADRPRCSPAMLPLASPPRGMPERVVLHLGAHKTGSTSLQRLLARNVSRLAKRGIAALPQYHPFVDDERAHPHGYRRLIRDPLLALAGKHLRHGADPDPDLDPPPPPRSALVEEVRTQLGATVLGARVLWLSDEDLLGRRPPRARRLYPNADKVIGAVREVLPVDDVRVVLYVRDLGDYLESLYVQQVQSGRPLAPEAFVERIDLDQLDWRSVARKLAKAVGRENVSVRRFEAIHGGFEAFAADFLAQVTDPQQLDLTPVAANPSLSAVGCDLARGMRPLLVEQQWLQVRRFLQRHFSTRSHPRLQLFDEPQRRQLGERYEAQLDHLRERFGELG